MKEQLVRFGVTVPEPLLNEFDQQLEHSGRNNRSEALRFLMRRFVTEERWQSMKGQVYGSVTLMYSHHLPSISKELTAAQHDFGDVVLCTTHVHISHDSCMECIILKGSSEQIQALLDRLHAIRGVKSIDSVITSEA